jgi:cytochrome c-type biogenesis protein CcmI
LFYLAAALIVVGVALFVAAPLGVGLLSARRRTAPELEIARLERERALAVQGLRELEFDREMGKLSDADYQSMHAALENRALAAMATIESEQARIKTETEAGDDGKRSRAGARLITLARRTEPVTQPFARRADAIAPAPRRFRFCPQCGERAAPDASFCAECGVALRPVSRATGWSE